MGEIPQRSIISEMKGDAVWVIKAKDHMNDQENEKKKGEFCF